MNARALIAPLAMTVASLSAPAAADARQWAPTRAQATVARVVAAANVRAHPGAGKILTRVGTQAPWTGGPVGLLVLAGRQDDTGRLWLKVRLPVRPNHAAGWIDANRVRTSVTPWRVRIRLRSRTVSVYRAGRLHRRFRAVVGKPTTPTPRGLFAVAERARQPDASAFLGPWALHLTAHSDVLDNYGGGPGRVAIHGRSGASLTEPARQRRLARMRTRGEPPDQMAGLQVAARHARARHPLTIVITRMG